MIHFNKNLCAKAKQLIKIKDKADMADDLDNIENHINALQIYPVTEDILLSANNLNQQLHRKYPIIDTLLDVGTVLSNSMNIPSQQYLSISDELQSYLMQDYFGILCHSLIKEKLIKSVEQFIDSVD